jgi:hypothetical protein
MKMDKSLSQRVMLDIQWVVLVLVYFMGDFGKLEENFERY